MWITRRLVDSAGRMKIQTGKIDGGEERQLVVSSGGRTEAKGVFPYGFFSRAAEGASAVMLDGICIGYEDSGGEEIEPGEIRLRSDGGAEIILKNSGEVIINGQRFPEKSGGGE